MAFLHLAHSILKELMGNAIKFSAKGSEIVLSFGLRPGWLDMTVLNTGEEIAESEKEAIFNLFHQADGVVEGAPGFASRLAKGP